MHLITNKRGGYERPSLLSTLRKYAKPIIAFSFAGIVLIGCIRAVNEAGSALSGNGPTGILTEHSNQRGRESSDEAHCSKTGESNFDCTDSATKAKVYEAAKQGIVWHEENKQQKQKIVKGSVSMYSRKDSCHNPKDGKCLTAIGRDTKEGQTIACPRSLKLGTKVQINGHVYTCEDRYANFVQQRHGDTYDIFVEDQPTAIKFGRQTLTVAILK